VNSGIFGKASRLAHLIARAGARRVLSLLKWLPAEQRADLIDLLLSEPAVVDTPHGKIRFLNHSGAGYWRARAIMTKEPGALEWIDSMVPGSVFWDIGANIGVLTLYAAMRGDLKVWAFEPAAVNHYNLVANCELNGLERASDVCSLVSRHVGNHGLARFAINVGALLHLQRKQEAGSKTGEFPIIRLFRSALSMSSSRAMARPARTT
jgi:hypothetical protein